MGVFDIFSNSDAQNAAAAQTAGYTAGYNQFADLTGQANNAINTNYAAALKTLLGQQGNNNAGQTQLENLLGIGPQGSAGIETTLQSLPGYQFALNQGTQNVMRNEAAAGQLNSGATDKAIADYTAGLASQNYNNYAAQLQPFLSASNQGAGNIAGVQTGQGNALSSNLTNQGNAAFQTQAGIGNAQANADMANLAQSASIFGGLTGLAGSALKLSDQDAKEDIEKVGELFDGTNVYRYRYKGSPRHEIGLIAQEVERDNPDAVGEVGRFKAVDYRKATNWAAELGRMAA